MRFMKRLAAAGITAAMVFSMTANVYAAGWENGPLGWLYQNPDGSYASNAWELINGAWYYFNSNGTMLENGITPDGFMVGADGAWVEGIAQQAQQAAAAAGITEDDVNAAIKAAQEAGLTEESVNAAIQAAQEAGLTEENINAAIAAAQEAAAGITEEDVNAALEAAAAEAQNAASEVQNAAAAAGITEEDIAAAAAQGYHCAIVFVIQMNGIRYVEPNDATQPAFREALDRTADAGVQVICQSCQVEADRIWISGTADDTARFRKKHGGQQHAIHHQSL